MRNLPSSCHRFFLNTILNPQQILMKILRFEDNIHGIKICFKSLTKLVHEFWKIRPLTDLDFPCHFLQMYGIRLKIRHAAPPQ